jgi:hypothetical protein
LEDLELGGIGRLLALTSNDEVNSLAVLYCADLFGRAQVFTQDNAVRPQPGQTLISLVDPPEGRAGLAF